MSKNLIPPFAPNLRTKKQRAKAARECDVASPTFKRVIAKTPVTICIGSKRKNTKSIHYVNFEQVYYWSVWCCVAGLKDGRFIFHSWKTDHEETIVSHSLENLWWYGVPEVARKAMTQS
jgi:hypothetical protein